MRRWNPQQFRKDGIAAGINVDTLQHALDTAEIIRSANSSVPTIFSLRHLAHLSDVDYALLRKTVSRYTPEPYTCFKIRKRSGNRFRIIAVPDPFLLKLQRWLLSNVLVHGTPHSSSVAYASGCQIREASLTHCGCRWLIKLDVANFFESLSEISVYRVFRTFGYQPLISFELARLCTRLGGPTQFRCAKRWQSFTARYSSIVPYQNSRMGHVPQGAATSPMVSNLIMKQFDDAIAAHCKDAGLIYTRYADDLCFSTSDENFGRDDAKLLVKSVYRHMNQIGLKPNLAKTRIVPPGGRKIVLGLLVDGDEPKLTKEFRAKMRMHLHYLLRSDIGPIIHSSKRGFESVIGLKNHLEGLISYAKQIDPIRAENWARQLQLVNWNGSI